MSLVSIEPSLLATELARLDARFPQHCLDIGDGRQVAVRMSGQGLLTLVCLHGIGSGAASWLGLAAALPADVRMIAWDAPGYGDSSPVDAAAPMALDYARRLDALLRHLDISRCVLVGHSLGAMQACAFMRHLARGRVQALALISPARGYGGPGRAELRAEVRDRRLTQLVRHGIAGLALERSSRLVSPTASAESRLWVRWNMERLNEAGYRQAIELLCGDDTMSYLPVPDGVPATVICGDQDVITTPASCAEIAQACGLPLISLGEAGHASYVERPRAILGALQPLLDRARAARDGASRESV